MDMIIQGRPYREVISGSNPELLETYDRLSGRLEIITWNTNHSEYRASLNTFLETYDLRIQVQEMWIRRSRWCP